MGMELKRKKEELQMKYWFQILSFRDLETEAMDCIWQERSFRLGFMESEVSRAVHSGEYDR